jgi:cutinase
MMNAVKESPKNVQDRIVGVVLFGYTKNKQTNSGIPGYPKNRVAVYCSKGDGVCKGTLSVTGGHFSYMADGTSCHICRDRLTCAQDPVPSLSPSSSGRSTAAAAEAPT